MSTFFEQGYTASDHDLLLHHIKTGNNNEAKLLIQKLKNSGFSLRKVEEILLYNSVKSKNTSTLQYLLDIGCNVNAQDKYGNTPLMVATVNKNVEIVELLLKNNANIYLTHHDNTSSLQFAISSRRKYRPFACLNQSTHVIVEMFFEKVNDDFLKKRKRVINLLKNADQWETFAIVAFGSTELTKYILKNGYEVNYRDPSQNCTVLHWAIIFAKIQKAKLLIKYGAEICGLNEYSNSPLACYTYNCEAVDENSEFLKVLLRSGFYSKVSYEFGRSSLESLFKYGNKKTVKTVLEFFLNIGVNLATDLDIGKSFMHCLVKNNHDGVLEVVDDLAIDFDINSLNSSGQTALMIAARLGSIKKVEFLLSHGADTNLISYIGESALYLSTRSDSVPERQISKAKVTEILLQHDADAQHTYGDVGLINICSPLSAEIIIAHLAILGSIGKLTDNTRQKIEQTSAKYIDFVNCKQQLEEMKKIVVHGKITLFKLLTEDEKTLINYARDQEFISAFNSIRTLHHSEVYYMKLIRERVSKVLQKIETNRKAASVIGRLTGICSDAYHIIVYKIMGYLNFRDVIRLCKIEKLMPINE